MKIRNRIRTAIAFACAMLSSAAFAAPVGPMLSQDVASQPLQQVSLNSSEQSQLASLIAGPNAPRKFRFCDADKNTRQCKGDKGLRAIGLGGVFLPLGLEVESMTLTNRSKSGNSASFGAEFQSKVNGVAPRCKDTKGTLAAEGNSAKLDYKGFYCNWLVIGNVVFKVELDVEDVNRSARSFSGRYTLRLGGTGNMFGRGYFVASGR